MTKEKLHKLLIDKKYSPHTIESWFLGRSTPPVKKIFELEDEFNIPTSAWRDFKSYLQDNDTKQTSKQSSNKK